MIVRSISLGEAHDLFIFIVIDLLPIQLRGLVPVDVCVRISL
jgi:hypothetical protein